MEKLKKLSESAGGCFSKVDDDDFDVENYDDDFDVENDDNDDFDVGNDDDDDFDVGNDDDDDFDVENPEHWFSVSAQNMKG